MMDGKELQNAIEALWDFHRQGIYYPAEWKGKFDAETGYRVQLGLLEKLVKNGETQSGWKVGLTAKAIQDQVEYHEPVFGFLLERGHRPSGSQLVYENLIAPSFESELCLTIGTTLKGPGVTTEQARAAITGAAPGIEVVEKRGEFAADPPLSLADNVQQRFYVTGPETTPLADNLALSEARAEVMINGEQVDAAEGTEVLGDPAASVAWLANRLSDFGLRLEAGMRVMSGSFTKQYPLVQGDFIETRFYPFGPVTLEVV